MKKNSVPSSELTKNSSFSRAPAGISFQRRTLDTFSRSHAGADFLLIGVSDDRSRDKAEVRKVMSAFAYPAALLSEAKVDKLDEPRVLPFTYVIDKAGVVRAVFGGTGTPVTPQRLDAAVRPLLSAQSG